MKKEIVQTELIDNIGIDRIELVMDILSINTELAETKGVNISYGSKGYETIDSTTNKNIILNDVQYKKIATVDIKATDKNIYSTSIKYHNGHLKLIVSAVLGRILYNDITNTNIYNVSESKDIKQCLNIIRDELNEIGIYVSIVDKWSIRYIEINKTIDIGADLNYYRRPLRFLTESIVNTHGKKVAKEIIGTDDYGDISYTYEYKFNTETDEFYDKTKQVRAEMYIILDKDLIRYEAKLDYKQIKNRFETTNTIKILCNKTKLNKLFNDSIQNIADIINSAIEGDINYYYNQLLCNEYETILKYYSNNCVDLFDIVILLEAIRRYYVDNNNIKNFSRDIKNFITDIDIKHKYNYESLVQLLTSFNPKVKLYKFNKSVMKYSTKNL